MMLSQWEASTKKIPAINASGKAKEKPAVRDLLTAGVSLLHKTDAIQ